MFYEGDLQSGIGKAVQESKLVACFVTGTFRIRDFGEFLLTMCPDDTEESQLWENEFLQADGVSPLSSGNFGRMSTNIRVVKRCFSRADRPFAAQGRLAGGRAPCCHISLAQDTHFCRYQVGCFIK